MRIRFPSLQLFRTSQQGFTLIELMVVVTIFALLASMTLGSLLRPQQQASTDTVVTTLIADLRSQQLRSMDGDTDTTTAAQSYGVYFQNNSYTMFRGATYSAQPSNFTVNLTSDLRFQTISLPNNQIVFQRRSGEVSAFNPALARVILTNSSNNGTKTITINRYGVVTAQ